MKKFKFVFALKSDPEMPALIIEQEQESFQSAFMDAGLKASDALTGCIDDIVCISTNPIFCEACGGLNLDPEYHSDEKMGHLLEQSERGQEI